MMIFHDYCEWVRTCDTFDDEDRKAIREHIERLPRLPLFSIVFFPPPGGGSVLSQPTISSLQRQHYPHWELFLPRAASISAEHQIRIVPTEQALDHASFFNAALAAADGEFVVPLPSDVTIAETALYEMAAAIVERPEVDILYSDEDRVDAAGGRCEPHFKTDWDPELTLGRDAIGLLVAYRKELLDQIGGMRLFGHETALSLYDLSLRTAFAKTPTRIRHIPAVLCHRKQPLPVWDAAGAREIVREHLARRGIRAHVAPAPLAPTWNRVVREVPYPAPLVSVIVPTRDRADLLACCAEALLSRTAYPALELLIVDNNSREATTTQLFRRLSEDPRVRILSHPGAFNYAAINNQAARQARGEILLLLNNDTDALQPDWLREMVSHATRSDVGAVGAKLLYADQRVQHAGVVLGPGPILTHQLRLSNSWDTGPDGELALTRTVSAVTGACLALRRSVFFEVGGLDENLRVAFNDIDLCMRIGDHGYRIVWTPFAELFHLEGTSRGPDDAVEFGKELQYFCRMWGSLMDTDPFHNKNVIYRWDDKFAFTQPRRKRPWLT